MEDFATDDLKVLADSYSKHNYQSNKLWSWAAILFVSVISVHFGRGEPTASLFGFHFTSETFYISVVIFSVFINFAYCSSHINNYKVAEMYASFTSSLPRSKEVFSQSKNRTFTYEDFAHALYTSNYNRYYPIDRELKASSLFLWLSSLPVLSWIFDRYKLIIDFVYSCVPFFTCLLAAERLFASGHSLIGLVALIFILVFAAPPWLALMNVITAWFRGFHKTQS